MGWVKTKGSNNLIWVSGVNESHMKRILSKAQERYISVFHLMDWGHACSRYYLLDRNIRCPRIFSGARAILFYKKMKWRWGRIPDYRERDVLDEMEKRLGELPFRPLSLRQLMED